MNRLLKGTGIIVGALVLTTLGISASDSVRGISSSLVGTVIKEPVIAGCGADAVELSLGDRILCVDRFEASVPSSCPAPNPGTALDSERNLNIPSCGAQSVAGALPWRFVNLSQAQRACAAAGKRLLRNEEWYRAALGTNPDHMDCMTKNTSAARATSETTCKSTVGAYDMVGNVWEWVDEEVRDGTYRDHALPEAGYVTSVDSDGIALSTHADAGDELYGKDYFWHAPQGIRGVLRGGSFGLQDDTGLYATHAAIEPSFASAGVGFRCVRELSL